MIKNLSRTAKIMILSVIAVCFVLLVAGLTVINLGVIERENSLQYAVGLALGGTFSVIKVVMMEKSLNKIAEAGEEKQAKGMGQMYFVIRFILTAVVLVAAALLSFVGIFGTIAGILSLKVAAYITPAVENRISKKEIEKKENEQQ